ncbi:MAG: hypothetical protein IJW30_00860 [Clostridia bacterium]|nr:hypothetical protein [Clostridia bacterium]
MKKSLLLRVVACVLCLCMLALPLISCAKEESETPVGMKSATCKGEYFRFYVPSSWNLNTAYGVSGAYYSATEQSHVSVVGYPITPEMETQMGESTARAEWYFENEIYPALNRMGGDTLVCQEAATEKTLGGVRARLYHHTLELLPAEPEEGESANVDSVELHYLHVVAERNGSFYVFSFTATNEMYQNLYYANESAVKQMLTEFRFADKPYTPEEPVKELDADAEAPKGMKLASTDDVAYLFYVPAAWEPNLNGTVYAANLRDESGRVVAVASVNPYMPTVEISVEIYAEVCEKQLQQSCESYRRLSGDEENIGVGGSLAGGKSLTYECEYTLNGVTYRSRQEMVGYGGMIYSVTYTTRSEDYDTHWDDAARIFEEFAFRRG